jgi:hypothetical protein
MQMEKSFMCMIVQLDEQVFWTTGPGARSFTVIAALAEHISTQVLSA